VNLAYLFAGCKQEQSTVLEVHAMNAALDFRPTQLDALPAPPAAPVAVPVVSQGRVLGMLFVDGPNPLSQPLDPASLRAMAAHFEAAMALMKSGADAPPSVPMEPAAPEGAALQIQYYARDSSVFVDGHYLIKGVAGAVLWKMLQDHQRQGRTEFCYRELRRDPALKLPDIVDNLGARMILLQQRLQERCPALRVEKVKRGLFRFEMAGPVQLAEMPSR
jgi:adenylate cyclase